MHYRQHCGQLMRRAMQCPRLRPIQMSLLVLLVFSPTTKRGVYAKSEACGKLPAVCAGLSPSRLDEMSVLGMLRACSGDKWWCT